MSDRRDWDEDGEQLRVNLRQVLSEVRDAARQRRAPTVEQARHWQNEIKRGLASPGSPYLGRFRGEPGLEGCEVAIGEHFGVPSALVAGALSSFKEKLQKTVGALDPLIEPDRDLTADEVAAVIDICAWVHAEWVRIHPFANGNGRTARLWANSIAMRYGLPPFVRLRPRPNDDYGEVATKAMLGDWRPTVPVFRRMYREAICRS